MRRQADALLAVDIHWWEKIEDMDFVLLLQRLCPILFT